MEALNVQKCKLNIILQVISRGSLNWNNNLKT